MSENKILTGQKGEDAARAYLEGKGYVFIVSNYRYKRAEVDLIMSQGEWLVFVEVKKRKSSAFGHPEEFVDEKKMELYFQAGEHYMEKVDWEGPVRFDVVAITGEEIEHFMDAFS